MEPLLFHPWRHLLNIIWDIAAQKMDRIFHWMTFHSLNGLDSILLQQTWSGIWGISGVWFVRTVTQSSRGEMKPHNAVIYWTPDRYDKCHCSVQLHKNGRIYLYFNFSNSISLSIFWTVYAWPEKSPAWTELMINLGKYPCKSVESSSCFTWRHSVVFGGGDWGENILF